MKQLLIILLLLHSVVYAQRTDYYYYNRNGVPEKLGYSEVQKPIEFAPYVPALDIKAYGDALIEMQRRYDNNVANIKGYLTKVENDVIRLRYYHSEAGLKANTELDNLKLLLSKNSALDFAKGNNYNWAMDNIRAVEKYTYELTLWAENNVEITRKTTTQQSFIGKEVGVMDIGVIIDNPSQDYKEVGYPVNGKVTLLEKIGDYYRVRSGNVTGYLPQCVIILK